MANETQNVAYLSDIDDVATTPSSAVQGNLPIFGTNHALLDSGRKPADFDTSIQQKSEALWSAINNAYALDSYVSSAWESGETYEVGDFCQYGGCGYRCIVEHTSTSSFEASYWTIVMTAAGKAAIYAVLSMYSKDGLAALTDLAPVYSDETRYEVGQMVKKDSVLQICTKAGRGSGGAEFSRNATVESSIATRLSALSETIPTKTSDLTNDSGFITSADVPTKTSDLTNDSGFITSAALPTKTSDLTNDSGFITSAALPTKTSDLTNDSGFITSAALPTKTSDLTNDSGFITSADVPTKTSDLTNDSGFITSDSLPFRVVNVSASSSSSSVVTFQLIDRAVNVISSIVDTGKTILLIPPTRPTSSEAGVVLARDFYVTLNISSASDISVSIQSSSIKDANGSTVSLIAKAGKSTTSRLTDSSSSESTFLISGYGDAAHDAICQIDKALDAILEDSGSIVPTLGMYLPDEQGQYHEIKIVTDSETGEVSLGVEQEGVVK